MKLNYPEDWGTAFQKEMDAYLGGLQEDLEHDIDPLTASGYTYCGCFDCDTREVFYKAALLAIEGYRAGTVTLVE